MLINIFVTSPKTSKKEFVCISNILQNLRLPLLGHVYVQMIIWTNSTLEWNQQNQPCGIFSVFCCLFINLWAL